MTILCCCSPCLQRILTPNKKNTFTRNFKSEERKDNILAHIKLTNILPEIFQLVHRTSFQSNSLLALQQFCTDFMVKSPENIFKSHDFTSLFEKSLIQLVKRDDLQMKEIEVWEHVLK
jgi:hypothetical protein